jgi:uncharacterized protein
MPKVILRFYEELNEYLPPQKHKRDFEVRFNGARTVREIIEQQGIPEEEVDLVLVDGQSVALDHVLRDGDRVSVYPVFERFDVASVTKLRKRPLRNLRFVAEKGLGETAERLNSMGFDVYCKADMDIEKAVDVSRKEKRILLTTRAELAKSEKVTHALYVAPGTVENQIRGILEDLYLQTDEPGGRACGTRKTG